MAPGWVNLKYFLELKIFSGWLEIRNPSIRNHTLNTPGCGARPIRVHAIITVTIAAHDHPTPNIPH